MRLCRNGMYVENSVRNRFSLTLGVQNLGPGLANNLCRAMVDRAADAVVVEETTIPVMA